MLAVRLYDIQGNPRDRAHVKRMDSKYPRDVRRSGKPAQGVRGLPRSTGKGGNPRDRAHVKRMDSRQTRNVRRGGKPT